MTKHLKTEHCNTFQDRTGFSNFSHTIFFLNDKRLHCFNQYLRWTRDGGPLPVLDFNFKDMEGIKAETFDYNVLHCTSYASLFPIFLDDSDKGRARPVQTCSVTSAQRRGEFPSLAHCSWILRQQVRFCIIKILLSRCPDIDVF